MSQKSWSDDEGVESDFEIPAQEFRPKGVPLLLRNSQLKLKRKVYVSRHNADAEETHIVCFFQNCRETKRNEREFLSHHKWHIDTLNKSDKEEKQDLTKVQVVCTLCW